MRPSLRRVSRGVCLLIVGLAAPIASPNTAAAGPWINDCRATFAGYAEIPALTLRATFVASLPEASPQAPEARPKAFEYSHGYQVRDRIHHIASFAMLPLFAGEAYVGQRMFDHPDNIPHALKSWHGAMATGIIGLFAVNSVTGVWNWLEGRKDPNAGKRRTIHAMLMLASDGGFVATALTSPGTHGPNGLDVSDSKKGLHAALAYTSISTATVGYLIMLFR